MIRIAVVISTPEKLSGKISNALHSELSRRLSVFKPDISVKSGSNNSLKISGEKDDREREKIMSIIQDVWESDNWIPE